MISFWLEVLKSLQNLSDTWELLERKTFSALCSSEFDSDSRLERMIILENLKTFEENFFRLAIFPWKLEKFVRLEVVTLS